MMNYNFDEIIDRRNTSAVKLDMRKQLFGNEDVLPMWVADMDFRTPDFIIEAVRKRADHPIYGYCYHPDEFFETIVSWVDKRHGWKIQKDWICFSPGIVPGINMTVMSCTQPGDKIIVQPPVYYPFFSAITDHDRIMVENPLVLKNGRYYMDFEDLENKIDAQTKMLILCSPHNPGGMVWTEKELGRLVEICIKNNLILISDEIHSDLVFSPFRHIPTASLSEEIANRSITCIAPSKTFNVAGLFTSALIIPDNELRMNYKRMLEKMHIGWGNIFGTEALIAAFRHGEEWRVQLLDYLQGNIDLVIDFCTANLPKIKVMKPEATYLLWLDFSEYGLTDEQINDKMVNEAGLGLSHGPIFGTGGNCFQRMNIASARSVVVEALEKLRAAFDI